MNPHLCGCTSCTLCLVCIGLVFRNLGVPSGPNGSRRSSPMFEKFLRRSRRKSHLEPGVGSHLQMVNAATARHLTFRNCRGSSLQSVYKVLWKIPQEKRDQEIRKSLCFRTLPNIISVISTQSCRSECNTPSPISGKFRPFQVESADDKATTCCGQFSTLHLGLPSVAQQIDNCCNHVMK